MIGLGNFNCRALKNSLLGSGETFSAAQIVGRTLIAKAYVPVKSGAYDDSPVAFTVKPGETIGVVSTYLNPTTNRSALHWEITNGGKRFYVKHAVGIFDTKSLITDGAKSQEQIYQEKKEEEGRQNDPLGYYLKKYGLPVLLIGGGIYLVGTLGKEVVKAKLTKPALAGAKRK